MSAEPGQSRPPSGVQAKREVIERLGTPNRSVWLFQCNPDRYKIFDLVADTAALPANWSAGRYLDQIETGDGVVFWLSGRDAGVYALGVVTGTPLELTGAGSPWWVDDEQRHRHEWFVPFDLTLDLFREPIRRADLRSDPRFEGARILRQAFAANPHVVTQDEWEAILDFAEAPWWGRAVSPLARRVAAVIAADLEQRGLAGDVRPVIDLGDDRYADALGVTYEDTRTACKELMANQSTNGMLPRLPFDWNT